MNPKVLITGGTGLIGTQLGFLLEQKGYEVIQLSRNPTGTEAFPAYQWDVAKKYIDERVFENVEHIIHLAGAGVADKRWTEARKQVILDSRVKSADLLFQYVSKLNVKLESFISASGISIYGDTGDSEVNEDSPKRDGFLSDVVKEWEASADQFSSITKVAKVRIGVVLSKEGGALQEIAKPIKMFVGAPLGSGKQYMSWIHIDDLISLFAHVLDKKLEGTFNAVSPNPVTNKALTQAIAKALNKPLFLPNVPGFMMKLILGEMSEMVLDGSKISSGKIESTGYEFQHPEIHTALKDLLG